MKKSFFQTWFITALTGSIIISSCSSGKYKPSEYISATGITNPEVEIKIELEDGAAIIIPANTTNSEVTVTVERNPEKANNLPPLDESVVKVGDFYNFEIDGTLNGPVDLVLPFDPNSVPENEEGVLVVAIPTENGWDFIPVVPNGNKVTLYTNQLGDPLIAWHFSNSDEWDKQVEEMASELKYCNPTIAVNVVPESGDSNQEFTITGRVIPLEDDFITTWSDNFASFLLGQETSSFRDIPVKIVINNDPQKTISTRTNQDGSFEVTINPEQDSSLGFNEEVNWLQAKAKCTSIVNPNRTSEAVGHSSFFLSPKQVQIQSTQTQPSETPIATAIPTLVETTIPPGAVLLPDFVGQPIDDAINWLESNGFKYTWIDGSSTYDLGMVFRQSPAGEQYKIPHRTVVILYRTVEKVDNPCAGLDLTPEECANYGFKEYQLISCTQESKGGDYCQVDYCNEALETTQYSDLLMQSGLTKLAPNQYSIYETSSEDFGDVTHEYEFKIFFTLNIDGYTKYFERHFKESGKYNRDCYNTYTAEYVK